MSNAALKLSIDCVQQHMRNENGTSISAGLLTGALMADHAENGGRYPTPGEVSDLVDRVSQFVGGVEAARKAFPKTGLLIELNQPIVTELNPDFFGSRASRSVRCHVRPRYSAGSPAMVPDETALQVARDEKGDYQHAREGSYGEEQRRRSEVLGLRGIVYAMAESGSGRKFRWLIQDLITGECFRRLHDNEITRQGFTAFQFLPPAAKAQIQDASCRDSDYDRTFWKYEAVGWVKYQPELVRFRP
jgi:hypothetical protein